MRHQSKTDAWLAASIWGGCAIAFFAVFFASKKDLPNDSLRLLVALLPLALTTAMIVPLYYEVRGSNLVIRCGLIIFQRVPIADIVLAEPSRCAASAPAMSLDRLLIQYRAGERVRSVLISPKDKQAFLTDLAGAAPHLRFDGVRLTPR